MQKWIDSALGANNFLVQKQQLLTIVFVQVQEVLFLVDHKPTEPMHWLCSSHKTFQVISSRLLFFSFQVSSPSSIFTASLRSSISWGTLSVF
jgi:hypothetical protein